LTGKKMIRWVKEKVDRVDKVDSVDKGSRGLSVVGKLAII